jgi:hypothetical protein
MSGKVTVIERRSLDLIRKEMQLQLSGDASDDSAQAIGKSWVNEAGGSRCL